MNKIKIYKSPNGDTRTAKKGVTFNEFQAANDSHRTDVYNVMSALSVELRQNALLHDWTKKHDERLFYVEFTSALEKGHSFTDGVWFQEHIKEERHHPLAYCHADINLLDILETIVDCVCAGMARSGKFRPLEINNDILTLAIKNTVDKILNMIELEK